MIRFCQTREKYLQRGTTGVYAIQYHPLIIKNSTRGWYFDAFFFRVGRESRNHLSPRVSFGEISRWMTRHGMFTSPSEENGTLRVYYTTRAKALDVLELALQADPPPWTSWELQRSPG